ncbi:hypothetical protein D3C75_634500 [compost metagenome]
MPLQPAAAEQIKTMIAGDPVEPGREAYFWLVPSDRLIGFYQNVLNRILGILPVPEQTAAIPVYRLLKIIDNTGVLLPVSLLDLFDYSLHLLHIP